MLLHTNLGYNLIVESNYPISNSQVKKILDCNQWAGTYGWFYADSPSGTPYGGQKRKPDATD
jgi:hypothetical protein